MKFKKFILEITVFICGALVMIYEIMGSRLLSPYIGASTYVWTSLIGVILAALSLGYWLGGKMADKKPDMKILASVIFLAGGLVSLTILLKDLILAFIAESSAILEVKSLLAAVLLFAPASVLLGFVTPYAVKLKMSSLADTGKTVGRLYALSTVGSIFGTFSAGFFLIPFVGSEKTLYLIGASLIGLSILLVPFALKPFNLMILILFVFGIGVNEFRSYYLFKTSELRDIDTEYSRVQIFKAKDNNGKTIRAMANDPYFIQSAIFPDSDEIVFDYGKYYHLIRHFKPDFQNTLMIGGAGYSFPKDYLKKYPNAKMDVVEIDPQMTEIARKYFRLRRKSAPKNHSPRRQSFSQSSRIKQIRRSFNGRFRLAFQRSFSTDNHRSRRTNQPRSKRRRHRNFQSRRRNQRRCKQISASRIQNLRANFPASLSVQSQRRLHRHTTAKFDNRRLKIKQTSCISKQ